ncbi:Ig-like domain-containing protein, partial [Guyparkeria sp.]|uniref:Ig-like domain-containing protein n=1 Tax=Guyparkeria sp. TaxID=2035736 RepID=UPI0039707110
MELTVLSLSGRAWAISAYGAKRELVVGDVVTPGERVVTVEDSRLVLSTPGGELVTVGGGKDVAVDSLVSDRPENQNDNDDRASAREVAPESQPEGGDDVVNSEGHRFVQLVPISETLEADGITPLTIAPINEWLRPLDMTFPDREENEREFPYTRGGDLSQASLWGEATRNQPPEARDDQSETDEDTPLVVGPSEGLLVNDSDPDGADDALRVSAVTGNPGDLGRPVPGSGGGLVTINPDGSYTFDPDGEFEALAEGETTTSSITYTVSDEEGGTDTATLTITVNGVNDVPEAVGSIPDQSGADAEVITDLDVSDYFDDPDTSDTLTYSATDLPPGLSIDPTTGIISGTPDRSASQGGSDGTYSMTVTATDPHGESSTQTFDWSIANLAPTAIDDTGTTDEDSVLTVASDGVLTNDSDPDGDPLTVTQVNGEPNNVGTPVVGDNGGRFTLD